MTTTIFVIQCDYKDLGEEKADETLAQSYPAGGQC